MRKFDFIVIGSGSGLEVSPGLSHAGWSVAIVEEGLMAPALTETVYLPRY
jgi:pyruvate/2-oxoglutarate dehydrogenase complex dihydrolipoamide dehydrogenase (E3) component